MRPVPKLLPCLFLACALHPCAAKQTLRCPADAQVSYRSINLKDEPYLVELMKEATCFVAPDVNAAMATAFPPHKSQVSLEFVLPDGVDNIRGIIQDPRDPRCEAHCHCPDLYVQTMLMHFAGTGVPYLLATHCDSCAAPVVRRGSAPGEHCRPAHRCC